MKTLIATLLLAASSAFADCDVLFYRDTDNPEGLPSNWPAKIVVVKPDATPPTAPWVRMTEADVEAAKAALRTEYNAWKAAREAPEKAVKLARETQIKNAIADLDLALANWATLTNAQVKEVTRVLATIIRALLKDELR